MKTWNTPVIESLEVAETAHRWTGIYKDGGYIGDGIISGHLSWDKPEEPEQKPENPTQEPEDLVSGL